MDGEKNSGFNEKEPFGLNPEGDTGDSVDEKDNMQDSSGNDNSEEVLDIMNFNNSRFNLKDVKVFDPDEEMEEPEKPVEETKKKYSRAEKKQYIKEQKKKKNGCLRAFLYFSVISAISVVAAFFIINISLDAFGVFQEDRKINVEIGKNMNDSQVAALLKDKGLIDYKWSFALFSRLKNDQRDYNEGSHVLNMRMGYKEIINTLKNDYVPREEVEITFPEGYTFEQIIQKLSENGVCDAAVLKAQVEKVKYNYDFVNEMPEDSKIIHRFEGYLFPDGYRFFIDDTPQNVYAKFLDNLNNKLTADYIKRANALGMTVHEVLTLASIIQRESGNLEQMPMVSSVFHNRLAEGSPYPLLQSDVTVWYPYYLRSDLPEELQDTFKSNYNTYSIKGLPPGPICNPGIDAIKAALYPADSDYYFFVTDIKGKYYYAKTFEEHKTNCRAAARVGTKSGTDTKLE